MPSSSAARSAARARLSAPLTREDAIALLETTDALPDLLGAAAAVRDATWGRVLTYSPKVFLPVTNLCRDRCTYCTFRKDPGDPGAWTMRPDEIEAAVDRARSAGCKE